MWRSIVSLILMFGVNLWGQSAFDAVRIVQDEMGFGARALSMGGAFTAATDNYLSIYWNPAGLASLRQSEFYGELSHLNFNNSATFYGITTDQSQGFTQVRAIGFALPLPTTRGSFVLSFGYNRVKDFDRALLFEGFNTRSNGLEIPVIENDQQVYYPFDKDVQQTEEVNNEGGLRNWSVAAAIALSPNVDFGVGLDIWRGQENYQLFFYQEDIYNNYSNYPADFFSYRYEESIQSQYAAIGVKIGSMFKMGGFARLGATIGLPVTFTVTESYLATDELVYDDGFSDQQELDRGEFQYKVQTPFYFDGGLSIKVTPFTLAASFRYRDWSQTRFIIPENSVDDPNYGALLDENRVIRREYRETIRYQVGGELALGEMVRVRGGYIYIPAPYRGAPKTMDRVYFTSGLGFRLDRYVSLNITYLYGTWKQESEDALTPGGTLEDIRVARVMIGLSYKF